MRLLVVIVCAGLLAGGVSCRGLSHQDESATRTSADFRPPLSSPGPTEAELDAALPADIPPDEDGRRILAQRFLDRGRVRLSVHRFDDAAADFLHSLRLAPGFAVSAVQLALVAESQGRWSAATQWHEQALRIGFPPDAGREEELSIAALAHDLALLDEPDAAQAALYSLPLNPQDPAVWLRAAGDVLRQFVFHGHFLRVLDIGALIRRTTPDDAWRRLCPVATPLARAAMEAGDWREGERLLADSGCASHDEDARMLLRRQQARYSRDKSQNRAPAEEVRTGRLRCNGLELLSLPERQDACRMLKRRLLQWRGRPAAQIAAEMAAEPLLRRNALGFNYLHCVAFAGQDMKRCDAYYPQEDILRDHCVQNYLLGELVARGGFGGDGREDDPRVREVLRLLGTTGHMDEGLLRAIVQRRPPSMDEQERSGNWVDVGLAHGLAAASDEGCADLADPDDQLLCRSFLFLYEEAPNLAAMDRRDLAALDAVLDPGLKPDSWIELLFVLAAYRTPLMENQCADVLLWATDRYCREGAALVVSP